jgi:hypothetical protein
MNRVGPVRDRWALEQSIRVLVEDALVAAEREGAQPHEMVRDEFDRGFWCGWHDARSCFSTTTENDE